MTEIIIVRTGSFEKIEEPTKSNSNMFLCDKSIYNLWLEHVKKFDPSLSPYPTHFWINLTDLDCI